MIFIADNRTIIIYFANSHKKNIETGKVYVGRTSGTNSPEENVRKRDRHHHMNEKVFGN